MSELELKFCLTPAAAEHWRAALKAQGASADRLEARYFDTPAGHLAEARAAVRLRLEGRHWVQTFKAAGDSPVHRLEHEVIVPVPAGARPHLDLSRHDGTPAEAALQTALRDTAAGDLVERYSTAVRRWTLHVVTPEGTGVEMALDLGEVHAQGRSTPLAELEIEYEHGPVEGLFRIAHDVLAEGGAWLSTLSKAGRGEALLRDQPAPPDKARPLAWKRKPGSAEVMRAVLSNTLEQVLANASVIAEGQLDAERLHQLRVGLRRLRTALRELGFLSGEVDARWEPELQRVFARLGEQRDSLAVADAVSPLLVQAKAPKTRWDPPLPVDAVTLVREPAFQQVLVEIVALAHAGDEAFRPLKPSALRRHIADALDRLHRRLLKAGRRFGSLPADHQHRARKQLKRLRYLAEFTHGLWPHGHGERYLDQLRPAQDVLGRHADCLVAIEYFRRDAAHDPRSWFAAGFLQDHLVLTAHEARRALKRLRQARPFWD
jgi:triphosphatase